MRKKEVDIKEMTRYVSADCPNGNGCRIKLRGVDLIFGYIENLFVYPNLDVDRFEKALSKTLSLWPIVTGRLIVDKDNDEYLIECNDQSIPLTIVENDQLKSWPNYPSVTLHSLRLAVTAARVTDLHASANS